MPPACEVSMLVNEIRLIGEDETEILGCTVIAQNVLEVEEPVRVQLMQQN